MYNRPCRLLPRHTVSADFTSMCWQTACLCRLRRTANSCAARWALGQNRQSRWLRARFGHVPLSSVHLGRVAAVNNLSREIAAHKYTVEQAKEKIEQIDQIPLYQQCFAGAGVRCGRRSLLLSVRRQPAGLPGFLYLRAGAVGLCFVFNCQGSQTKSWSTSSAAHW